MLAALLGPMCEINVSFAQESERLVSLKPNVTEIIFDLGRGGDLVGVTQYCDRPPAALKINKVADYVHVDVEKVLIQKPTLVLGAEENSQKKQIHFLRDRGLRVELFSFKTLEEIKSSIQKMGNILGKSNEAKKISADIQDEIDRVKNKISQPSRILIVVGVNPLVVVGGKENYLHDVTRQLGLVNVAAKSQMRYPQMGMEDVIAGHPDVILILTMGSEKGRGAKIFERFGSIEAVKKNQVFELEMDDFRPSPGLVKGIREVGRVLSRLGHG